MADQSKVRAEAEAKFRKPSIYTPSSPISTPRSVSLLQTKIFGFDELAPQ